MTRQETLKKAIEAMVAERKMYLEKADLCDGLLEGMKLLLDDPDFQIEKMNSMNEVKQPEEKVVKTLKESLNDYPHEGRLSEKVLYISRIRNRPLRFIDYINVITEIEGAERAAEYRQKLSAQLGYLMKGMKLVGQKYSTNTKTFYFLTEWATWDGVHYKINLGHEITPAEFERADVPEFNRKSFIWLPEKLTPKTAKP